MKKSTYRGFTLIELIIVVAIVGILAMIAYPNYSSYVRRGYMSAAQAYLLDVAQHLESFRLDNKGYPAAATDVIYTPAGGPAPTLTPGQVSVPAPNPDVAKGYGPGALPVYAPFQGGYSMTLAPVQESPLWRAPDSDAPRLVLYSTGQRCKTLKSAGGLCGPGDKQWSDR